MKALLQILLTLSTVMTALCGIFCFALWVPAQSYAVLLVFALFSGTVTGTFWGTVVPVVAEVSGLQRLSSAFSMVCLPLMVPTVFAEPSKHLDSMILLKHYSIADTVRFVTSCPTLGLDIRLLNFKDICWMYVFRRCSIAMGASIVEDLRYAEQGGDGGRGPR